MGFPHGTCTAPPRQSDDCHARWHRRRPTCREAGPLSVPTGRREVHSGSCVNLLQSRLCMIHINFCLGRLFLLLIIPARTRVTCTLAVIDDRPSLSRTRASPSLSSDHSIILFRHANFITPTSVSAKFPVVAVPACAAPVARYSWRWANEVSFKGFCATVERTRLHIKRLKQCLRFMKIGRVEAFGEPGVNWREDVIGFFAATLCTKQASEADGGAQLISTRTLLVRDGESRVETSLDLGRVRRWQALQQITPQPMEFGIGPPRATLLSRSQRLGENRQPVADRTG